MPKKKLTKAQITHGALHEKQAIDLLREIHKGDGTIILPQVRNGTGHTYRTRTADALICETWASRGIGFTGVEYKRSRSDWLSELKAPAKAEEIGKFCRYWAVLAPAGLIDVDEVPELWGLWEIHDNTKIKVAKRPPLRKYREPTIEFVCSILRSNHEYDPAYGHDWKKEMAIRTRIESEFKGHMDRVKGERDKLKQNIHEFEHRTGLNMSWDIDSTITLTLELKRYLKDPTHIDTKLTRMREQLMETVKSIDKIKVNR